MAIVPVNIGSADNDGTGDPLRTAFGKLNTSISELAPLASPALTGNPTAPTQTLGNNTTRIATTAFVKAAIDALIASAPGALDTLDELAAALGDDANFATTVTNALAAKAPTASPTFTGLITNSGGQIKFPATDVPSSDANTLDDYEEGTWTPALTFGGGSTGLTYSARAGSYTKIGNRVIVDGRVTLSAKGSSTGTALIGGLPFTVGGTTWRAVAITYYLNAPLSGGLAETASTNIRLFKGGATTATHADFADDSSLYFTLTYTV